jgi:DNA-directed RNA polymerase specialized sigma24 family protein
MDGTHGTTDAQRAISLIYPRLLVRLERMLGRRDVAEDVAQKVCEKALMSSPDPRFLEATVFRMAFTTAIDEIRRENVRGQGECSAARNESTTPEDSILRDEVIQRLGEIVSELKPALREVFVLCYL